jgi:hypothetical protein
VTCAPDHIAKLRHLSLRNIVAATLEIKND